MLAFRAYPQLEVCPQARISSVRVSVSVTRFESMFEVSLPDGDALHGADDADEKARIGRVLASMGSDVTPTQSCPRSA